MDFNDSSNSVRCNSNPLTNPFLQKVEEYKRINDQLEKKSSELFDRIDNFSKSSRLRLGPTNPRKAQSLYGGDCGDGVVSEDEHEHCTSHSVYDYRFDTEGSGDAPNNIHEQRRGVTAIPTKRPPSRLQQATESVIKNLQGKMVNQDERMTHLSLQYREKIQENTILESRIKLLEEEREKYFKTVGTMQGTVEKHAQYANTVKNNLNIKESALAQLKKENFELKKDQRSYASSAQSFQARLDRAVEENQRLKTQNRSMAQRLRDLESESRQKMDSLLQRIHELERQKTLVNSNLLKQVQLSEKLKRQVRKSSNSGHDLDDRLSCFSS